ncbi:ATP-dependent helicase C-terminal domain-containing protein, partial [Microbacterium gubbeenense]
VKRLARFAGGSRGASSSTRDAPGVVAGFARPDWIARRVAASSRVYLLASGTRAALPEGSGLIGSEWIAVCEVQRADGAAAAGTGAVIRLAAALAEPDALAIGSLRTVRETAVEGGRAKVREERRLGAIVLSSTPGRPRPEEAAQALIAHVRAEGLEALTWPDAARALRSRLGLIHREIGEPWPDVGDGALLDDLEGWLGGALRGSASLAGLDLTSAIRGLLPWPEAARLDQLAPERLAVPSGSSVRIEYPADAAGSPVVAVKLQEVFGLAETPRLVDGRVAVQFHLLSPARRPLAVTGDLASFWNGPYQDVRKEMRGRYPKHPWPEDPWTAPATARTTRRIPR